MAARIRKGDQVVVTTGKDKGREGSVIRVMPDDNKAIVQGVNMVRRHTRQSQTEQGGIISKEAPIHVSNLAHIDPKDGKPTRVGFRIEGDGEDARKVRFAKRSGEAIDD